MLGCVYVAMSLSCITEEIVFSLAFLHEQSLQQTQAMNHDTISKHDIVSLLLVFFVHITRNNA